MWKFCLQLATVIIILFSVQSTIHADERTETYMIIEKDQKGIIEFMKTKELEIEKVYTAFSIVSASLTADEVTSIQTKFPRAIIHSDNKYEQSKETELESIRSVQATLKFRSPYSGAGIKVAVLDSGVDTEHRDLKVKGGYCSLPRADCAPKIPYDDDNGHGTHVAGIIAALNNGTGIVGIAPEVDLYSIKALNVFGVGSTKSLIDGVEWAIKNEIDILNLSITTETSDPSVETALKAAYDKGMLLVGSAGNNGEKKNKTVMYPAKYEAVIAVGAVDSSLKKLKESAVGPEVEIVAPGGNIFSTYPIEWDFFDDKTDGYTTMSGTSMATPHVTGVLALYKERFPSKTNVELRQLLIDNAKDLSTSGKNDIFGYGLVQYKPDLPSTISFDIRTDRGKLTLTNTNNSAITVVSDGKKITPGTDGWELYGVSGEKEIFVTTSLKDGKKTTEKQFVTLKAPAFIDVKNSQPFSGPVGFMSYKNQINGFEDGTFRPYTSITRGEAAALIGRSLGYSAKSAKTKFKDVPESSFASGYIKAATDAKIISGFSDGTFRPGAYVTRAEMAILISKAYDLKADQSKTFKDVSESMAAYSSIKALTASAVTTGYSDDTFKPYDNMTRSDFAVFIARVQNDFFK